MPSNIVKIEKGRSERRILQRPKDWSTPLLEALSFFSSATKADPAKAYELLQTAVKQRAGSHQRAELLRSDVQKAMEICETRSSREPSAKPPMNAEEAQYEDRFAPEQHLAGLPAKVDSAEHGDSTINQASRSADNSLIKREFQNSPTTTTPFHDVDEEEEKLRELELRREIKQAGLDELLQKRRVRQRRQEREAHMRDNATVVD